MLVAIVLVFGAAMRVNGHFETRDALQAPLGVGKGLNELLLAESDRLVFVLISGEVIPIDSGIVRVEEHGAVKPVFTAFKDEMAFPA